MCAPGRPITLLLCCLLGSATSSPVSTHTPSPPLPSQILPPSPSPAVLPSPPSPSLSTQPPVTTPVSNSGESTEEVSCPLTVSPSTLVVRFGDPVTANCSVQRSGFPLIGWLNVSQPDPEPSMDHFLVWSVDRTTEWDISPLCYTLVEQGGQCHVSLSLILYKPPDNVSISVFNHTGPMSEGRRYTLQCTVQGVAPVEKLAVTFYRGQKALGQLQSNNTRKTPVTEIFTLTITSSKDDDGAQFWCEAKLELGPEGPKPPPVVVSQKLTATVLFGPDLVCPVKLQVREGERLSCEVRGNPQPQVTWYRDGQVVTLPTRSSRKHAGRYTVLAMGPLEQKNFTVEVVVLTDSGSTNSSNRHFLLAVLLIQMMNWL